MHQRHTLTRQLHKIQDKGRLCLEFLYVWVYLGVRVFGQLNKYLFIYSIMSPQRRLMSLEENPKKV